MGLKRLALCVVMTFAACNKGATPTKAPGPDVSRPTSPVVETNQDAKDSSGTATQTGTDVKSSKTLDYNHFAKAVIDTECVTCHGAPPSGGAPATLDLSSFDDSSDDSSGLNLLAVFGVKTMANIMAVRLEDNTMPPGGWKADPNLREQLLQWLDAGAPENIDPKVGDEDDDDDSAPDQKLPQVSVTAPATLNLPATSDHFAISVKISDAASGAAFDVYRSTTEGATSGGQLVASARPVSQASYTWDLSGLPNGAYFVYVILHSGGVDYPAASTGSVLKSPPESVNHNPQITLAAPFAHGASAILASSTTDLGYTASDADGDPLTFVSEYSSNGGTSWTAFTCGSVTNAGCTWNTAALTEGVNFRIRITAQDGQGGAATATSTASFGVAASSYTYNGYLAGIMTANCESCHAGGFSGFDSSSFATVSAKADRIVARASVEGSMPDGGAALPASDRNKIQLWFWQGATAGTPPTPTISVAAPAAANSATSGGSYTVQVVVEHAANGATYDLFATSSQGATTGGQQIVVGRAATLASFLWDPSALANGAYFVYAVLHSGGQTYTGASSGSVLKNTPTNHNPTVALSSPFAGGNAAITSSASTNLTYSAADSDGDTITYTFEFSANGGSSWTSFSCSSVTASGCIWDTSGLSEGIAYRVRVSVADGNGGSASTSSSANFGLTSSTYTYANFLSGVMGASCNSCHSGGGSGFTSSNLTGVQASANRIALRAATDGTMPSGGPPLSAANRTKIQLWFWQGAN